MIQPRASAEGQTATMLGCQHNVVIRRVVMHNMNMWTHKAFTALMLLS